MQNYNENRKKIYNNKMDRYEKIRYILKNKKYYMNITNLLENYFRKIHEKNAILLTRKRNYGQNSKRTGGKRRWQRFIKVLWNWLETLRLWKW